MYDKEALMEFSDLSPLCLSISASPRENDLFAHPPTSPTYFSFPSPTSGRSPTLPTFRVPKYGYYNIEEASPTMSSPLDLSGITSPRSDKKSSILRALIQSINFFVGIGVLALPYALRMTGWFGLVLLVSFCSIMTYTALLFGKNRRKFTFESFSDHIEFAFPTKGRVLVSFIFYSSLLFKSALFLLLLADLTTSCTGVTRRTALALVTVLYVAVANVITSSSVTAMGWIRAIGTISIVLLLALLLTAEIQALVQLNMTLQVRILQPNSVFGGEKVHRMQNFLYGTERVYWTDFKACLDTLGIFGYCYMGHEVFPSIFHNMKHPSRYAAVVYIAFGTMLTSYATVAALGYLAYGSHSAGNIVDNLPPGEVVTLAVKACIIMTSITKILLSTVPLTEGLLEWAQLAFYLAGHSSYLAHLGTQAPRRMPQLRLHASRCRSAAPTQSTSCTYGTYDLAAGAAAGVPASTSTGMQHLGAFTPPLRHPGLDNHRGESNTFNSPPSSTVTAQSKLTPPQLEHTGSALSTSKMHRAVNLERAGRFSPVQSSLDIEGYRTVVRPQPRKPSILHHSNLSHSNPEPQQSTATPRRGLTWSDTIPIPPIRSPSCENINIGPSPPPPSLPSLLLSGSTGSRTASSSLKSSPENAVPQLSSYHNSDEYDASQQESILSRIPTDMMDLGNSSDSSSSSDEESTQPGNLFADLPTTTSTDVGYETGDTPQMRRRLYEDFQPSVDTRRLSCASASGASGGSEQQVSTSARLCTLFQSALLPVLVRTLVPLAAMGIALLFSSFVSMIVFIGGVYGGTVSIVIPAWAYFSIRNHELLTTEKFVLSCAIAFGFLLSLATLLVPWF